VAAGAVEEVGVDHMETVAVAVADIVHIHLALP